MAPRSDQQRLRGPAPSRRLGWAVVVALVLGSWPTVAEGQSLSCEDFVDGLDEPDRVLYTSGVADGHRFTVEKVRGLAAWADSLPAEQLGVDEEVLTAGVKATLAALETSRSGMVGLRVQQLVSKIESYCQQDGYSSGSVLDAYEAVLEDLQTMAGG